MTFEKWWEDEARGVHKYSSEYDLTQAAWQAATLAERERCEAIAWQWHDKSCGCVRCDEREIIADAIRKGEGV